MHQPLFSIILPVFNSENTIKRCIDSILIQSVSNFELIIINDGSTDSSPEIIRNYGRLDDRIKIVEQINHGVSAARNAGLETMIGKYVLFIDSDDYVAIDFILGFYNILSNNNLYPQKELIIQNGINEKKIIIYNDKLHGVYDSKIFSQVYNLLEYTHPWGKLFNAKIINDNNVRFDSKTKWKEDSIFFLDYLKNVDNIYIDLTIVKYIYTFNENSLSYKIDLDDFLLFVNIFCQFQKESNALLNPKLKIIYLKQFKDYILLFIRISRSGKKIDLNPLQKNGQIQNLTTKILKEKYLAKTKWELFMLLLIKGRCLKFI